MSEVDDNVGKASHFEKKPLIVLVSLLLSLDARVVLKRQELPSLK